MIFWTDFNVFKLKRLIPSCKEIVSILINTKNNFIGSQERNIKYVSSHTFTPDPKTCHVTLAIGFECQVITELRINLISTGFDELYTTLTTHQGYLENH